MLYTLTYTNDGIPEGADGFTKFWFIKIRPECKRKPGHLGIIAHEQVHIQQFWLNPLWHILMYGRNKKYTIACEVEAYKMQLLYYPYSESKAGYISEDFAPSISRKTGVPAAEIVKMFGNL
ncbi:hypothetical protein EHM76_00595 [bacterium]|nr:MAG: hypothetical protein EHM76_00595 [bacterium]